jgi:hypothetical protein
MKPSIIAALTIGSLFLLVVGVWFFFFRRRSVVTTPRSSRVSVTVPVKLKRTGYADDPDTEYWTFGIYDQEEPQKFYALRYTDKSDTTPKATHLPSEYIRDHEDWTDWTPGDATTLEIFFGGVVGVDRKYPWAKVVGLHLTKKSEEQIQKEKDEGKSHFIYAVTSEVRMENGNTEQQEDLLQSPFYLRQKV